MVALKHTKLMVTYCQLETHKHPEVRLAELWCARLYAVLRWSGAPTKMQ